MQTFWTIQRMFPNATTENVLVTVYGDGTWEITKWDLTDTKPTNQAVEDYWNANQQAILNANVPPLSDIESLKKQQADVTFQLMMNGVL